MTGPADTLIRQVQARIDEAAETARRLDARRASLALDAVRDPTGPASEQMLDARRAAEQARAVMEDLVAAMGPALRLASQERDAAAQGAVQTRYAKAVAIAGLRLAAAERVDALTGELASAMLLHDGLAQLCHGLSAAVLGEAASSIVTAPCVDSVIGQLARHQAIPREMLPPSHVGEIGYVHLTAEAARRHQRMLLGHAPKPVAA